MNWTITLLAMGLRQRVRVSGFGEVVQTHTMDFEGRLIRHDYTIIAIDEPRRLATAIYAGSHVVKKRARRGAAA